MNIKAVGLAIGVPIAVVNAVLLVQAIYNNYAAVAIMSAVGLALTSYYFIKEFVK